MPELYDKATCATELRMRAEILEKVRKGRTPKDAFEVEDNTQCQAGDADSTDSETSSTSLRDPREDDISQLDCHPAQR